MHNTKSEVANYDPKDGVPLKIVLHNFFSRFKNYVDPEQDISPFFQIIMKGADIISLKVIVQILLNFLNFLFHNTLRNETFAAF